MSKRNFNLIATKKSREDPIPDKPINFPPLENLHLELLENKKKIKPGLPDVLPSKKKPTPIPIPVPPNPSPIGSVKETFKKSDNIRTESIKNSVSKPTPPPKPVDRSKPESIKKPDRKPEPPKQKIKEPEKRDTDPEELILEEIIEDDDDLKDIEEDLGETDEDTENLEELDEDEEEIKEEVYADPEEAQENTTQPETEETQEKEEEPEEDKNDPYYGLSPEEREKKEKEEYIWRFRILKKKYKNPSVEIPDYNEHSELADMKVAYDRTTKELYLDGAVDQYRTYLIGGFMVAEFVCTNWFNIDLGGFTTQQTKMMYKYDMLLIELGEKSYNKWGMNIPVEVRIAGLILLQAGLFYLGKVISANYGNSMAGIFKGITGQPDSTDSSKEEPTKKKMKGPKFKAEDIRNMAHVKSE